MITAKIITLEFTLPNGTVDPGWNCKVNTLKEFAAKIEEFAKWGNGWLYWNPKGSFIISSRKA